MPLTSPFSEEKITSFPFAFPYIFPRFPLFPLFVSFLFADLCAQKKGDKKGSIWHFIFATVSQG